jgi:hypothetical protein
MDYQLRRGDLVVDMNQPAKRIIPLFLELQSACSIFNNDHYNNLVQDQKDFFILSAEKSSNTLENSGLSLGILIKNRILFFADIKGRYLDMKVINRTAFVAIFLLLLVSSSTAQVESLKEMTVVVPAQSLAKVIKPLLPYRIDLGKNFLGSFYVKSIENISINNDKISFSSLISGKDIKYATTIGKQVVNFAVGDVNLPSRWEVSFDFDKSKKTLFIKPHLQGSKDVKEFSQGDALLTALSELEYPVELNDLKPVKSEIYNQVWILNMDITDIYAANNKLFIELVPIVQIDGLNEQ